MPVADCKVDVGDNLALRRKAWRRMNQASKVAVCTVAVGLGGAGLGYALPKGGFLRLTLEADLLQLSPASRAGGSRGRPRSGAVLPRRAHDG